mmetsp:Transcript_2411/g.4399  ORF Transcript_2411/g.4399 Transcript_2411/m.4399 type:complete len:864 (+) Transcript_2411:159-2750(+)
MEVIQTGATIEFLKVLQRAFNSSPTSKYNFCPFNAVDNTIEDEMTSNTLVTHNVKLLTSLVTTSRYRDFLGAIIFNPSCAELLDSYLNHRYRCTDKSSILTLTTYADLLSRLDQLICQLYVRLMSSPEIARDEDCMIALPEILSTVGAVRLPRLLSIFAIMGDSNRRYSQKIFNNTAAKIPLLLRKECTSCAEGTYQTLYEITLRLDILINPVAVEEKKHKVVDLSKSRPKKNSLKNRDVFSERGAGMKKIGQGLTAEVCDLAEFVMDITHSLYVWIECGTQVLGDSGCDASPGLKLIGANGLAMSPTCAVIIACMAVLYEHTIPLLEKVVSATSNSANVAKNRERVERISIISREMLVQVMRTLFSVSSDASRIESVRTVEDESFVLWEEVIGKLLSSGGRPLALASGSCLGEDALRIIVGGGGLLADVARAHSTTFFAWLENVFEKADAARKQYTLSVMYEGDAGYLSRDIIVAPPAKVTESYPEHHGHVSDSKSMWQSTPETVSAIASSSDALLDETWRAKITSIQTIFPDYGENFVQAVLRAFDNDPDRALDALLSDNLPPTLTQMDRTSSLRIKAAFVGKSSTDNAVTVSKKLASSSSNAGNSAKLSYSLELNHKEKALQKQILSTISQQDEMDSMLLSDMVTDFIDDYDDQYDEAGRGAVDDGDAAMGPGGVKNSSQRNSTSIILDKKGKPVKPKQPKAITKGSLRGIGTDSADPTAQQSERDRVLRLNKLAREKEAEDEFWDGMRNTNHSERNCIVKKKKGAEDEPEELEEEDFLNEDDADKSGGQIGRGSVKAVTVKVSDVPSAGPNKGGAKASGGGRSGTGAAGAGGRGKKPRTKTFDKHNQKKKSTKKFGGFS